MLCRPRKAACEILHRPSAAGHGADPAAGAVQPLGRHFWSDLARGAPGLDSGGFRAGGPAAALLWLAYVWLLGLFGHDFQRGALERRGYVLTHVLAARDEEAAYARLLAARPELITPAMAR
jgi:hypothetical protein